MAGAVSVLAPGAAGAAVHCVQSATCAGTPHTTVAAALGAAQDGDTVHVGAGTFNEVALNTNKAITIEGEGDATELRGGTNVLTATNAGATVRNLRVRVPSSGTGIVTSGVVEDVQIVAPQSLGWAGGTGVELSNAGVVRRTTIALPVSATQVTTAVKAFTDGAVVEDSVLAGTTGISASAASLDVRRTRITAARGLRAAGATMTLSDSLVTVAPTAQSDAGASYAASALSAPASPNAAITVRGVTVLGPGTDDDAFGFVTLGSAGGLASIGISSTVILDVGTVALAADGGGQSVIGLAHSDFDPARVVTQGAGIANVDASTNQFTETPAFVDAAAGDYTPAPGSTTIDKGEPQVAAAFPPPTDLLGRSRAQDGDGDGVPRPDIGAFEADGIPPVQPPEPASDATTPPAPVPTGDQPPAAPAPVVAPAANRLTSLPKGPLRVDATGRVTLKLRCAAGTTSCKGRLRLRTLGRPVRTVGTRRYVVAAGARRAVRVRLSVAARRTLRRTGRMRIRVAVTQDGSAPRMSRIVRITRARRR